MQLLELRRRCWRKKYRCAPPIEHALHLHKKCCTAEKRIDRSINLAARFKFTIVSCFIQCSLYALTIPHIMLKLHLFRLPFSKSCFSVIVIQAVPIAHHLLTMRNNNIFNLSMSCMCKKVEIPESFCSTFNCTAVVRPMEDVLS